MDNKEQLALIEGYLADEVKLYQDWHDALNQIEVDSAVVPYSLRSSLEELKERFDNWFNEQEIFLRKTICEEWDYPSKREEFQKQQQLIAALVDELSKFFVIETQTITTAVIFVVNGYLDHLCFKERSK